LAAAQLHAAAEQRERFVLVLLEGMRRMDEGG
jgi:hypothetical protein